MARHARGGVAETDGLAAVPIAVVAVGKTLNGVVGVVLAAAVAVTESAAAGVFVAAKGREPSREAWATPSCFAPCEAANPGVVRNPARGPTATPNIRKAPTSAWPVR